MQVTKEPLDPCQVALTIEVEQDKVVHAVDQAYREYARRVNIPGFRKGKAPMHFVRQRVAESDVRQRTAEILVEPAYLAALKEADVTPYTQPSLEILQLDLADKPFIFKAVVPLPPHVELGQYKGLNAERTVFNVPETMVDAEINGLLRQAIEYPIVLRPARSGDFLLAELSAKVEGRPSLAEPKGTMIEIGGDNLPGFDEQVEGLSAGDVKTFALAYPSDFRDEDLQGLAVEFTVLVKEVRESHLPVLDDEVAAKITNGKAATAAECRSFVRTEIEEVMNRRSNQEVDGILLTQVVHNATINFPSVMLETAVEEDTASMQHELERMGMSIEEYINRQQTTREAVEEGIRKEAEKRIKAGLVLGEIADQEKLDIEDIDISSAIAEQAAKERTTPAAVRAMLERTGSIKSLRNRVQTKKILDFLRGSAKITDKVVTAPTGDATDSADSAKAEPAGSKKTRIKKGAEAK